MRPSIRPTSRWLLISAALACAAVATTPVFAGKGNGNGGGGGGTPTPPPAGTIFFGHEDAIWAMKGDGSGKQFIMMPPFNTVGSPSRLVYGDDPYLDRWWLTAEPVLDGNGDPLVYDLLFDATGDNVFIIGTGWEAYRDDGTQWTNWPQEEIFAVRPLPDGSFVKVQVTSLFGSASFASLSASVAGIRWSHDGADSFLSFVGYDWRSTFSIDAETGVTSVRYDSSTVGLFRVPVSGAMINAGLIPWSPATADDLEFVPTSSRQYCWSPDGTELAAVVSSSISVFAGSPLLPDRALGSVDSFARLQWSPDGSRVTFDDQGSLYIVPADGSAAATALLTPSKGAGYESRQWSDGPAWSPDSAYIITPKVTTKPFKPNVYDIVRVPAGGGSPVILTGELTRHVKAVLGWVPDEKAP